MKITDDTDLLVGEYVLGTLERDERAKLEEIAEQETTVAAAVMVWERRLAPLHELIVPAPPPDTVWPAIAARLGAEHQEARPRDPGFLEVVQELARSYRADTAMRLVQRMRRWRTATVLFGATALFLAAYLGAERLRSKEAPPVPLFAVLRSEAFAPPFIVALDLEKRTLQVRSVPGNTADDRTYAFWLLRGQEPPVALGNLRGAGELKPEAFSRIDRASLQKSMIAVSIEPNSAPRARPSGPYVYRGAFEPL